MLQDASQFASNIDSMMKQTLGIADQEVDEEEELEPEAEADAAAEVDGDEDEEEEAGRDELWLTCFRWRFPHTQYFRVHI